MAQPCPACKSHDTKTLHTRYLDTREATWRRHECGDCGVRYSSLEFTVTEDGILTIKPIPGTLQPSILSTYCYP